MIYLKDLEQEVWTIGNSPHICILYLKGGKNNVKFKGYL